MLGCKSLCSQEKKPNKTKILCSALQKNDRQGKRAKYKKYPKTYCPKKSCRMILRQACYSHLQYLVLVHTEFYNEETNGPCLDVPHNFKYFSKQSNGKIKHTTNLLFTSQTSISTVVTAFPSKQVSLLIMSHDFTSMHN